MLQAFRDQLDKSDTREVINDATGKGIVRNDNTFEQTIPSDFGVGSGKYRLNEEDTEKRIATLRNAVLSRNDEIENGYSPKRKHQTQTLA